MASLVFNSLSQKLGPTSNKFTYADLHLDFADPVKRDIETDYDVHAIKNSIVTLFNTIPGQNLLNPPYGMNLLQYLFEPASTSVAQFIGDTIYKQLKLWEPRVTILNINVGVDIDAQTYTVSLSISIPTLNNNLTVTGTLTKNGFTLLN